MATIYPVTFKVHFATALSLGILSVMEIFLVSILSVLLSFQKALTFFCWTLRLGERGRWRRARVRVCRTARVYLKCCVIPAELRSESEERDL